MSASISFIFLGWGRLRRGSRFRLASSQFVSFCFCQTTRSPRTGNHCRNRVEQHLGIDWFGEIRRCTSLHGTLAAPRGMQSGYHHDRHVGVRPRQPRLDLKAVHLRHVLVEDNTVRRMSPCTLALRKSVASCRALLRRPRAMSSVGDSKAPERIAFQVGRSVCIFIYGIPQRSQAKCVYNILNRHTLVDPPQIESKTLPVL
jgi:hypothetical protein